MNKMNIYYKLLLIFLCGCSGHLFAQTTTFTPTGTVARYVVPGGATSLSITAKGAQGGLGTGAGGSGAIMIGTFTATPGHVLKIIVGQQTTTTFHYCGGGGGGSFVWDSSAGSVLLLAAGGGGGGGYSGVTAGLDAVTTANGTNGGGGVAYGGGGVGGSGGTIPSYVRYGAGGAGWSTNGAGGLYSGCSAAGGGQRAISGGLGGIFGGNTSYDGTGGFGGGGGAQGCYIGYGGGGGGFSGGGGGAGATYNSGGGGGSFNAGAPQSNSVGNLGDGIVIINQLCVPPSAGAISGPLTVCVGASISLTNPSASPPGFFGGWSWTSSNPSIAIVGATTGIVTGVAPGVDTITFTVTFTCGTATIKRAVTVNPLPAAISGYVDVCPGSTTILTDATPGGRWSSSAGIVAAIGSLTGLVSGLTVGTTLITYTDTVTTCTISRFVHVVGLTGLHEVCAGNTITITPTVAGGTWSTGDAAKATVDTTGVVSGVSLGTVAIGYTLSSGCTLTWVVTVDALAPIVGTDSVCLGSERYVTDIVGGGVWTSSNTSVATITSDSGKVSGLTVGITTITYTLPTGCKAMVDFSVIDYPPSIIGNFTACPYTTTALVDVVGGGRWTSGNNGIATVDPATGVVTGVTADTVDIYYTIAPGCTIYTTITINPLPDPITGSRVICPGTKDTLFDSTPWGVWSSMSGSLLVVDSTGIVTALLASGNGTIRYTLPLTGCYRSAVVTVDPLPVPVITYNWVYGTLYATPGFATYQWYDSTTGLIPGATSSTIAATENSYYYVVVTDAFGCRGVSGPIYYNVSMVGINNTPNAQGIGFYPNPASSAIYFESQSYIRVIIASLDGRAQMEQSNPKEMDISHLANGIYLISVYDEKGERILVKKLVKE